MHIRILSTILFILLPWAIFPVAGDEQRWDNTKDISAKGIIITAPREFQTCIISPDGGSGWDTCTAYILITNNKGTLPPEILNFDALWQKMNTRNVRMEFTKNVYLDNKYIPESDTFIPYMQFTGLSDSKPQINIGEHLGIKISFEKERWQRTSFDFRGRFDIDEMLLDPDISECGTLNSAGATYTLINNISSTGTCLTISADDIILDGAGWWVNHSNLTGSTKGIAISNNIDGVTIKNINVVNGNTSVTAINGIDISNIGTDNHIIDNVTVYTITSSCSAAFDSAGTTTRVTNSSISSWGCKAVIVDGNYGYYENNTMVVFSGSSSPALSLSGDDHNVFINNTIHNFASNQVALSLSSSDNNTFTGGSVYALYNPNGDYSLTGSFLNTFTNTNFSSRKVSIGTANTVWFNYSNNSGVTWLSSNISAAKIIYRTLLNWTSSNITFSENITVGTATATYNISGLLSLTEFNILVGGSFLKSSMTDSTGQLPLFSVDLTTTPQTIVVQPGTPPAQVTGLIGSSEARNTVNLIWTANTEPDLWGYQVFRDNISIRYTQTNSYTDTRLPVGTYQYEVRANDTNNNWGTLSDSVPVYVAPRGCTVVERTILHLIGLFLVLGIFMVILPLIFTNYNILAALIYIMLVVILGLSVAWSSIDSVVVSVCP